MTSNNMKQREIKFRAWHLDDGMLYFDFDSFQKDYHDQYGNIMQFTGLTDKNGKEIYEGDILKSTFGYNEPFMIKFGEYNSYDSSNTKATSVGFYFDDCGEQIGFGKSVKGNTDCYEIIGNIYENPKLL